MAEQAGWQPIATAPKDGTHFLACVLGTTFGWLNGVEAPPVQTVVHWWGNPGEEGFYTSVSESDPQHPFGATHWKALDAPSLAGAKRGALPDQLREAKLTDTALSELVERLRWLSGNAGYMNVAEGVLVVAEQAAQALTDLSSQVETAKAALTFIKTETIGFQLGNWLHEVHKRASQALSDLPATTRKEGA